MTDRPTLGDVTHTPPHDSRNPVQRRYQRGGDAVTDGGDAVDDESLDATDEHDAEEETLKDVDHTPPDGEGVNHVYQRGATQE